MARWAIANDHAGLPLKSTVADAIRALGHELVDLGTNSADSVDYPDFAHALASKVASGEVSRGVLICGSGIGVSIAANRHKGVRAALCSEPLSAALSRQHNDANVLCMGARIVGAAMAEAMVKAFDATAYEGGRHQRRVDKIEG
ncbi:MAG: ribose 5-phosphate isomerase B [Myxococcales bacterium]|nr:ribose 5-phosphate isomerase B [Myxococcales bacterium]